MASAFPPVNGQTDAVVVVAAVLVVVFSAVVSVFGAITGATAMVPQIESPSSH